jgi:uncharacterized membrane protein YidH (DUF202 family)
MYLSKKLPPARDARIYMSVERTYLGNLRLAVYIISVAIVFRKLAFVVGAAGRDGSANIKGTVVSATALAVVMITAGLVILTRDINYIDGGTVMSENETRDPRIYMAAERTFLAWVRTAISLIIFGFVIEKFEFLLAQFDHSATASAVMRHDMLVKVGIFIIFSGIVTVLFGLVNFQLSIRQVDSGEYRTNVFLYRAFGSSLAVICLVVVFFLLQTL